MIKRITSLPEGADAMRSNAAVKALVRRSTTLFAGLRDGLAAAGANNIARQYHRLDRRSRFEDWSEL